MSNNAYWLGKNKKEKKLFLHSVTSLLATRLQTARRGQRHCPEKSLRTVRALVERDISNRWRLTGNLLTASFSFTGILRGCDKTKTLRAAHVWFCSVSDGNKCWVSVFLVLLTVDSHVNTVSYRLNSKLLILFHYFKLFGKFEGSEGEKWRKIIRVSFFC